MLTQGNVCFGSNVTFVLIEKLLRVFPELVEEIQNAINYEVSIDYNLTKPAGVSKKTLNGSNGSQILKWEPEWSLSEGINETTKWYLESNYG